MSSNVAAWWLSASPASRAASTASRASGPMPTSSAAPAAATARPASRCAASAISPSSSMSPSTHHAARPPPAASVSSAARTDGRVGVVGVVEDAERPGAPPHAAALGRARRLEPAGRSRPAAAPARQPDAGGDQRVRARCGARRSASRAVRRRAARLEGEGEALGRRPSAAPTARTSARARAGAHGEHARPRARAHGEHARVVGVEHHRALRRDRRDQRRLLAPARRRASRGTRCGRSPRIVTAPTVGRAERGERGDLARAGSRRARGRPRGARAEAEQRQRQPPLVVEAALGLSTGPERPRTAAIISLVVVLPLEPVTAATGTVKRSPVPGGEPAERARRVVHEHHGHAGRQVVGQRVHDEAAPRRGPPPRAGTRGRRRWWPRIAKNASPTSRRAGVDAHAGDGHAEVARRRARPGSPRTISSTVKPRHARGLWPGLREDAAARPRGRRTAALGADDLVRLVALARDHHHVARRAPSRWRRRWPRGGRPSPRAALGASPRRADAGAGSRR